MRLSPATRLMLLAIVMLLSAGSFAQIGISVTIGPPALPVYEQPLCPGDGYIWTPGYWAYGPDGYYWVPGTWVLAPRVGFLWTPPWWEWFGGRYVFHDGYWGPRVGFYGGIVYGFGYFGRGYEGGRWEGDHFFYNRTVNNINVVNIHNVYNTTINNVTVNHISYNGGQGGVMARPTAEEQAYDRESHVPPTAEQTRHFDSARDNPQLRASENHGRPPVAATPRPGAFNDRETVGAREAGEPYRSENGRPANNVPRPPESNLGENNRAGGNRENNVPRPPAVDAKDLQPHQRMAAPNTGNPNLDKKYQQQQDKLYAKQEQDHQKLQQKQEQEHQRLNQQNANDAKRQQVEQRHQQQTQQMEQRHAQQQQQLQHKEESASHNGGKR